ncbi:hypothetical protein [Desulfosudis oleivorans]|uniref:Porin n=1 Tax=Desulfosudis oleivorans (strain DSM 6200 / JCM 39069 / Hxd3) TaxID=96561 RepID=A8ZTB8_DESOH|nr:hypothetical protein [Desulfosudis oleivorans]ABW67801.1 conserved hypothetical protein [Desulfosudis oleivorans Hxd3]
MGLYRRRFWVVALVALLVCPAGAVGMTLEDLQIHGFISQGFLYSTDDADFLAKDSHKGTLEFNEMAINFSATPTDDLSVGMQLAAFDLGTIGNDEVMVDWAFGDYSFRDYLGLRAGIIKIPLGLYNDVRKIDMVRTSILLPTSVYPEWFREAFARIKGVGLYGTLPGNISYQALYGTVDIQTDGGLSDGLESLMEGLGGMDTNYTDTNCAYAGKLQWDAPVGLKLAASVYTLDGLETNMNSINYIDPAPLGLPLPVYLPVAMDAYMRFEPITTWVLSAEYITDRLTLAAEYAEYDLEFNVDITTNLDPAFSAFMGIPPRVGDKTTMQGYYGSASYRVLDNLEVGTYYSEFYYDKDDHDGGKYAAKYGLPKYNSWLKDTCLSARYDISPNWCAKIEGHLMDGTYLALGAPAGVDSWELYAAKLTYSF